MAGLAVGAVLLVVWLVRRKDTPPSPPANSTRPQPTPPPTSAVCPRCGATLPPDSPQGLCPRCVLGVGLTMETEATGDCGPHGTKIVPPPEAEVARRFPHLEILGCLGQGGMGVVYKARQPKLNRFVALKILAPEKGADPKFAERFLREAQALARLSHPNIVTVHDFGEADGMFFLLMEFVDGMTLRQLMREARMKPEQALAIVPKICEALQFAHEQGVVHRDIKPENVLLDKQGRVKIADFGIAKLLGTAGREGSPLPAGAAQSEGGAHGVTRPTVHLTQDQIIGTPHYMAPEQVEKPTAVDHRADIYSLGVVFYEMLTGELPLGKFQPPSKKVQVDVRLDEVVLHALEKEPERRYQQASQVKTDVETIAATPAPCGSGRESAPSETARPPAVADTKRNAREATIVFAGTVFFLFMLAVVAEMSLRAGPFRGFLVVICVIGLIICALSLAGLWPFPSPWFPEPNFSSRNLRRHKAMAGSEAQQSPRFSRTAIVGALWAPLFLIVGVSSLAFWTVDTVTPSSPPPGPAWWQLVLGFTLLPLGLTAPFGTTILGTVAISQIRHSRGRLYGLGLAVFDALFFPLLVLNALILGAAVLGLRAMSASHVRTEAVTMSPSWASYWWLGLVVLGVIVLVDWLIIRAVWRTANKPVSGGAASAAASASTPPNHSGSAAKVVGIVAAVVLLVLAVPVGYWLLARNQTNPAREPQVSAQAVVRVEDKLRREILQRLEEGGWKLESLSVSVSPNMKRAECRFGKIWKNGLTEEPPPRAAIQIEMLEKGLWQVRGEGLFESVRFSVDTSAEMAGQPPGGFQYSEPEESDAATRLARQVPRFGPVRELMLNHWVDDSTGGEALDLDRGELLDLPKEFERLSEPVQTQWLKDQGADLLLLFDRVQGRWGLITVAGNELKLGLVPVEKWDTAKHEDLSQAFVAESVGLEIRQRGELRVYLFAANQHPPLTLAFHTARGARGLLQITRFTAQPESARLRYKLLQSSSGGVAAPTPTIVAPEFGPVRELTLQGRNESRTNCFIDFESGQVLDAPATLAVTNRAAVWEWAKAQGVDAVAMTTQEIRGLLGYELIVGPLRDEDWEAVTSEDIAKALTKAAFNAQRFPGQDPLAQFVITVNTVSTSTNQPRTYAFRTREGRSGMLQFLSYTDAPGGSVTIRYKLAPSPSRPSPR
ncbi:MAG: protein kinase [Verrucomicrobiae bacterium]|nr:protein kinase [Verrucomicrobiae bacterium]